MFLRFEVSESGDLCHKMGGGGKASVDRCEYGGAFIHGNIYPVSGVGCCFPRAQR